MRDILLVSTCGNSTAMSDISHIDKKCFLCNQFIGILTKHWVHHCDTFQEWDQTIKGLISEIARIRSFQDLDEKNLWPLCSPKYCEKVHVSGDMDDTLENWALAPETFVLRYETSNLVLSGLELLEKDAGVNNFCTKETYELSKGIPLKFWILRDAQSDKVLVKYDEKHVTWNKQVIPKSYFKPIKSHPIYCDCIIPLNF